MTLERNHHQGEFTRTMSLTDQESQGVLPVIADRIDQAWEKEALDHPDQHLTFDSHRRVQNQVGKLGMEVRESVFSWLKSEDPRKQRVAGSLLAHFVTGYLVRFVDFYRVRHPKIDNQDIFDKSLEVSLEVFGSEQGSNRILRIARIVKDRMETQLYIPELKTKDWPEIEEPLEMRKASHEDINKLFEGLNEREVKALKLYYGWDEEAISVTQLAAELGNISYQGAQHVRDRALGKIKRRMKPYIRTDPDINREIMQKSMDNLRMQDR